MTLDAADACLDPGLPWVSPALDPFSVQPLLAQLPKLAGRQVHVCSARLTRHKHQRRCAIEYDLKVQADGATAVRTVIGRIRARHDGVADYARADALWRAFSAAGDDGILIPEPIGAIPSLHMWLQYKVAGRGVGDLITARAAGDLPERIAEAAHKVHTKGVAAPRRHTVVDEIGLLDRYLGEVARLEPRWSNRIGRVLEGCRRLASGLDAVAPSTIHGDFYHDQMIVSDRRVYLIDFDLYAFGDPALDVGNFVAHLTELGLRTLGDPLALAAQEDRLVERYLQLAGSTWRRSIDAFTTLALARHIYLSVARPGRRATAEAVLELCEERFDFVAPDRVAGGSGPRGIE